MNALAGALVLIFVLYLIDRHNLWRLIAKMLGVLAVLAAIAVGTYEYSKARERKELQEQRQKADADWVQTKRKLPYIDMYYDCLDRNLHLYAFNSPAIRNADAQCEKDCLQRNDDVQCKKDPDQSLP
jgi:hypothetical protein